MDQLRCIHKSLIGIPLFIVPQLVNHGKGKCVVHMSQLSGAFDTQELWVGMDSTMIRPTFIYPEFLE